jgi:hypothetical protein
LAQFQSAVDSLDALRNSLQQFVAEAQSVQSSINPLPHLKEHPRQSDTPSKSWDMGNLFAARRTEAFVRATFDGAGSSREKAFAFGVLSSYASNVAGSAYLGQVVGGPRRSHRYRDRLARYATGAWIHKNMGTPSASKLGKEMKFTGILGKVAFPYDLQTIAQKAFQTAFPTHAQPDLGLGLSRLSEQLSLLDVFVRPPLPDPPPLVLASGGEVSGTLTIMSDELNPPTVGVDLDPDMTPSQPSKSDSSKSGGGLCLALLIIIATLALALLIYCIGKWTTEGKCVVSDFFDAFQGSDAPDPRAPTGTTQSQLTTMSAPEAAAHIAQELYNVHMLLWQAFDLGLAFLAATGLVYPDDLLMTSPLYSQFVTTPVRSAWPHRPDAVPEETYYKDPTSPIEQPSSTAPFASSAPPSALFATWASFQPHTVLPIAQRLLLQIVRQQQDSQNYDMDADRGFLHPCWECSRPTSINDPILSINVLPYSAD